MREMYQTKGAGREKEEGEEGRGKKELSHHLSMVKGKQKNKLKMKE